MLRKYSIVRRYWSLTVALVLPVIVLFVEGPLDFHLHLDYQILRAATSILCIALLVHSWFMQRKYTRSKWRLAFLTVCLSLPTLGASWLGLNVIRSCSYNLAADYERNSTLWYHDTYWIVVEWQDRIVIIAKAFGIAAALWAVVDLVRWVAKRFLMPR